MRVAIIGGSGKMGRWCAAFLLKEGHEVVITGRNESKLLEAKRQLGVEVATNVEAAKQAQAIIISVPIDNFEPVVEQICPHTHPEQVILDITSIKAFPVKIMHKHIKTGLVLGVHPMFGPGARGIANQSFVLTPTNEEETALAQKVREYLETRGARASLMSPDEHDEMMAVILGLSHFIAIVSADTLLSIDKLKQMRVIGGSTFKLLLTLAEGVISEDPEFYTSLQMNLPNVAEIEKLFQRKAKTWADLVENKDSQRFAQRMNELKDRLYQVNPDFGKAYKAMYKLMEGL
ncbi:MAG: prephenate dehydrogenase [Dehalococcoidia bacterium]|nr:MAG: prephenate dehydrogenase [Dehalococcoidia bacterium]